MSLAALSDGVIFNEYEEKPSGDMTYGSRYPTAYKDLTYLLPQQLNVQQLLLKLSAMYRFGESF